ncbi:hypothetical protein PGO_020280 [Plasmodium gonderi]|uniref:Uncharacterized protein n=1 Tax=Plasmodium gonderi TaxID=77519 RepID=A0A1Y1J969_PLAGO|nr:hypothetical protein PGO_020280 [Plasmodium gonderi]GAW79059.1 hypothetical protein PGO_020280 [Plasmodium gonderi]
MEQHINTIGEWSEKIHNTATKILPDIKNDIKEYKTIADSVVKGVQAPDGATLLLVLTLIFTIALFQNLRKMVGILRNHYLGNVLLASIGYSLLSMKWFK